MKQLLPQARLRGHETVRFFFFSLVQFLRLGRENRQYRKHAPQLHREATQHTERIFFRARLTQNSLPICSCRNLKLIKL